MATQAKSHELALSITRRAVVVEEPEHHLQVTALGTVVDQAAVVVDIPALPLEGLGLLTLETLAATVTRLVAAETMTTLAAVVVAVVGLALTQVQAPQAQVAQDRRIHTLAAASLGAAVEEETESRRTVLVGQVAVVEEQRQLEPLELPTVAVAEEAVLRTAVLVVPA